MKTTFTFDPRPTVVAFMSTFETSVDPMFWINMVEEETTELHDALRSEPRANQIKEACDLCYVLTGLVLTISDDLDDILSERESARFDSILDDAKTAIEGFTEAFGGYEAVAEIMSVAFFRVHESNMSKLGDDGEPIRRDDGKIMKGPNYFEPDLTDL